jgi:hypothetical protein
MVDRTVWGRVRFGDRFVSGAFVQVFPVKKTSKGWAAGDGLQPTGTTTDKGNFSLQVPLDDGCLIVVRVSLPPDTYPGKPPIFFPGRSLTPAGAKPVQVTGPLTILSCDIP